MARQYSIIKRDPFLGINQYLEVHIRNIKDMFELQKRLEDLSSVRKANPNKDYFIVYVREPYTITELENEVDSLLRKYYDSDLCDELHLIGSSLVRFSKAKALFDSACEKYILKIDDRGVVDNFRLSMELLLKEILKNNKSLENQQVPLNEYLKQKGVAPEIIKYFWHVLDCFNKYQNNHVKHDFNINENDMPIIIEQTKSLFNTIIKLEGE